MLQYSQGKHWLKLLWTAKRLSAASDPSIKRKKKSINCLAEQQKIKRSQQIKNN
jgi:hypothetical protein